MLNKKLDSSIILKKIIISLIVIFFLVLIPIIFIRAFFPEFQNRIVIMVISLIFMYSVIMYVYYREMKKHNIKK